MTIINEKDLATQFLKDIDASPTSDMLKAVASWMRQESGARIVRNNPWNLTSFHGMSGFVHFDGAFAVFDNLADGIKSTATGLMEFPPSDWRGYAQIVAAAKSGDAARFMQCLAQSAWDAGRYGTVTGGPNHIVNVYDTFHDYREVSVSPGPLGAIGIPSPTPKPTPHPTTQRYTVQPGDTLWDIASHFYHNGNKWPYIYRANRALIGSNPSLIHPGQVLTIPKI